MKLKKFNFKFEFVLSIVMAGLSTKLKRLRGEFESKTRGIQSSIERFEQAYQKSKNVLQKLESYEKTGSGLDTWVSRSGGRDNRTTTRYVGFKIGSDFETLYSTSTRQGRHRTTSSGTVPAREELDAKISQMIQAEKQKQINIPYAIADLEAQASIRGSWEEEERESMALAKERELKLATEQVNKAEIQAQSEIRERNRLQKELRQKKKQARFEDVTKPKKVFRPKQSFFNIKAKSFRYF